MSMESLDRLRAERERHSQEDIRLARRILAMREDEYNKAFHGDPGSLDYEDAQTEAEEVLARYRRWGYDC